MTTTATDMADLVTRALANDDPDLAAFRISRLRAPALRDLCLELAQRVPAPTTGDGSVLQTACEYAAEIFSVGVDEIASPTKRHQVVEARHAVCYAGHLLGMPYAHIGRQLGRDHTTVMNAVARVGTDRRLRGIATSMAAQLGWDREESA